MRYFERERGGPRPLFTLRSPAKAAVYLQATVYFIYSNQACANNTGHRKAQREIKIPQSVN